MNEFIEKVKAFYAAHPKKISFLGAALVGIAFLAVVTQCQAG